ncbi:MAG: S-layer homology domain-containing protein, partial [Clostridia bacterium]
WNFDMTRTLDADSIYYIKVGTYGVGEYGVVVEGGNADENTADFIEVSGTISLPEGIVADEDIVGAIGLIEKSWIEQDGRAEYNPGKSENFIMTEGTSDVSYTLKVPSGKEYILGCQLIFDPDDLEYILLEYIPLGLYGSNGTVTNIDEAEIITTTQEANMILLPKASVESPERAFDTVESAGELIPGSNITEKVDYVLDRDFYHITVSDPGYYMLDLKIDGLDDMINNRRGAPIEIRFMDAEGNDYYFYRVPELIYADNKIVGMSLIQELSVGDYYYVITSSDMDSVDRLKLCEYELSFNKASQITCDIRLPENLINYDGVFGLYDNQGMGYVLDPEAYYGDRSVLDDSGKKSSLSYEAQGNNNEFLSLFVPYDSQASYILGYSMYTYDEYSDMGYYAHENIAGIDIGFTVDNMTDATPIYAGEESSISFEVEFIADTGNDSMETAFILVPNTFIKGTINREMDMDYFKFDAPVAGNYQISYEGNLIGRSVKKSIRADNKLGLFVYENDKWVQYAEDVKGNISRHFSEGEHYIKIGGTQDSDHSTLGPYKLLLNCSPFVENVHISGSPKVGSTLTSAYIYTDADGDLEGNSRYRWLRADSITSEYSAISGAVNKTYTLTSTDIGKYIKFEVLPVTAIAPEVGEAVLSNAVGPVAAVRTGGGGGGGGSSSGQKENVDNAKTESTASGSAAFTEGLNGSTNAVLKVESSKIAAMLNASGTSPVKIDVKTSINAQNVEIVLAADILAKTDKLQKTVAIEANNVSFEIQPNTLDSDGSNVDLTLRVDELSLDAVPEAQRNKDATADDVSMVFDFGMYLGDKKVTEFNKPVTITVKYDASKVTDTSKLGVYYYNEKDSKWEYVGGKVNTDGTITFEVEHFSKYAAMEYTKTFDDITKHWAKKDIEIIIGRHITNGVDNNNFKPDLSITRAEFVTMLVRALNLKTTSGKIFEDVPASAWFKEYIQEAYAAGIIRNSDSDHFSPTDFITREQMAEMLVNAYSYASDKNIGDMRTTQQIRFKDEEMADNSVGNSIILANALKLMVGNPDGTFAPKANATRAQTAVTIRRLLQELKLITEESLSIEMN